MKNFSDRDLIQLSVLVYLDGIMNGHHVKDIVNRFLLDNGEYFERLNRKVATQGKHTYPSGMNKEEWLYYLKAIQNNDNIKKLVVKDLVDYGVEQKLKEGEKHTGFKAITFLNKETNDSIVSFRGTSSNYQWYDNAESVYLSETYAQREALEYINSSSFNKITAIVGHSKGGNLAHYVGVMSNKVKYALSFAGPGFSKAFFEEHTLCPNFNKRRKNLVSIIGDKDIAGGMLFQASLPENTYFFNSNNKYRIWQLSMYHKPCEIFSNPYNFDNKGMIVRNSSPSTRIYYTHKLSQGISKMDKETASSVSHLLVRGIRRIPL